jgi:citrate lyase gamma subunit
MIKDVMVRLDGTPADDVRLAPVGQIAEIFDSHITGLLFNALPPLVPDGFNGADANEVTRLLNAARQAGDAIEATVLQRLAELPHPANLRRFDVVDDGDASDTALQMARAADTFVASAERPSERAGWPRREPAVRRRASSVSRARRA